MSQKDKMAIVAILLGLSLMLLSPCAGKAGDVGMVQTQGAPTCEDAKNALLAVGIRLNHLKDEFQAETNESLRFVIKEEALAVVNLGRKIQMFRNEQCREA